MTLRGIYNRTIVYAYFVGLTKEILLDLKGKFFFFSLVTLDSRIIVPPTPIVNFFHPGHLYSNHPSPPIINFQSFLLTFLSVNSYFHHNPS